MSAIVTSHHTGKNTLNDRIHIATEGAAGAGGAYHRYRLDVIDTHEGRPGMSVAQTTYLTFPTDADLVGITNESLLAVVMHRLEAFQSGPFACAENTCAIQGIKAAMACLKIRTINRVNAGVLSKPEPLPGDKEAMDEINKMEAHTRAVKRVGRIERIAYQLNFYAKDREAGDQEPIGSVDVADLSTWGAWSKVEQLAKKLDPVIAEAEICFLGVFATAGGQNGFKEFVQAMQQHCGTKR